ncbi:MAG TPA: hypothetical protein VGK22_21855 [Candidatus Angelobacter sp.]|jgi:hypothetical protein
MFSLAALLLFLAIAPPMQDEPKPVISKEPLTAEQIAVYRAMLQAYAGDKKDAALNISNVTYPSTVNGKFTGGCPKDTGAANSTSSESPVIHRMDPVVALNSKMVLVDPEQQEALIRKNDPQNVLMNSVKDHQPRSDSDLDRSLKTAFSTGLFSFSEIVFNKQHTRAILEYGSVCGWLCGGGATVILKKTQGQWDVGETCSIWMS